MRVKISLKTPTQTNKKKNPRYSGGAEGKGEARVGQDRSQQEGLSSVPSLSKGDKLRSLGVAGDIIPGNSDSGCRRSDGKCLILLSPQGGSSDFHFCAAVASRPCVEHRQWGRACPSVLDGFCWAATQSARRKDSRKWPGSSTLPAQPHLWLGDTEAGHWARWIIGLTQQGTPYVLHLFL